MASVAVTLAQDRQRSPLALYGELFVDVQMQRVFDDGKTFVDAVPRQLAPSALRELYARMRSQPSFSLRDFVRAHFLLPSPPADAANAGDIRPPVRSHIRALWPRLVRRAEPSSPADTSLPLPQPFVVPGGRFRELYYWDSYFAVLGLLADGVRELAGQMVVNFANLIDRYGFVPNGTRSYMLTRSQPPLFYKMVQAVGEGTPGQRWARHLPQLEAEHAFWMHGEDRLAPGQAHARLVRLPDGTSLNRYWDERDDPREESWREDVLTARASGRDEREVFRDLRAGAESGWDFSSRWCAMPDRLETIETTAILPVDLNCLLHGLESAIAQGRAHGGDADGASVFAARADARAAAIRRLMWHAPGGHFVDYHWRRGQALPALTAAALLPLYTSVATAEQASATAAAARARLLAPHGLLTTLEHTTQQWDAPNGWAPLQWMAVQGLRRYGHDTLARDIAVRWLSTVHRVYRDTGRLMEKYDVTRDRPGGGGEYEAQDGFGWTNGVFAALSWRYGSSLGTSEHS